MERGTEYGLEQVFNVIDSRYRSGKPLIVSTNLTLDDLHNQMCIRDRYNTYHEQKQRFKELQTVKRNIDQILRRDEPHRRKEQSHER